MEKTVSNKSFLKFLNQNNLEVFKQLSSAKCLALDLGRAESRLVYYFEPSTHNFEQSSFESPKGLLRSVNFDNKHLVEYIEFIQKSLAVSDGNRNLKVTGVGAEAYKKSLESSLGVIVEKVDETECLINGCNFVLGNIFDAAFQVDVTSQQYEQQCHNTSQQQTFNEATQQHRRTSQQFSDTPHSHNNLQQTHNNTHGRTQSHDVTQQARHDINTHPEIPSDTTQQNNNSNPIERQYDTQNTVSNNKHKQDLQNNTVEKSRGDDNDVKDEHIKTADLQPITTVQFNPPIKHSQISTNQNHSIHQHNSLDQNSKKFFSNGASTHPPSSSSSSPFLSFSSSSSSLKFVNSFALSHYPYLLVDVGLTINIYKVTSACEYEKVTSHSVASVGAHVSEKDMSGLLKVLESHAGSPLKELGKEAKCLLTASFTCHHYAQLHNIRSLFFTGDGTRWQHKHMSLITHIVTHLSKGLISPMFLRHNGFLTAVGVLLREVEDLEAFLKKGTFSIVENMALSNGMEMQGNELSIEDAQLKSKVVEFIVYSRPRAHCPLVDPSYQPDTFDLSTDGQARLYWVQCFRDAIHPFMERAAATQKGSVDVKKREEELKKKYLDKIDFMEKNSWAFGPLTVRNLLVMREHYLREFHFVDPFYQQKQLENSTALLHLAKWLQQLEELQPSQRWLMLVKGLLAGNVFDWGAKEIAALMQKGSFGFEDALASIPVQPWLIDDSEVFIERMQKQEPYKCVAIFVDNSGFDIVLGVFPFARQFLLQGSKVILCANSRPAINDVTYDELVYLANKIAELCDVIKSGLSEGRLLLMESGQGSPCLDLRSIDITLSKMTSSVDLLLLEGMGRAVHTNLYATFLCPVIKVCVLKNRWVAERLGGRMFDAIFKFQTPPTTR